MDLFRFFFALLMGARHCAHCSKLSRKPYHRDRLAFCTQVCWQLRKNLIAATNQVTLEQRARQAEGA